MLYATLPAAAFYAATPRFLLDAALMREPPLLTMMPTATIAYARLMPCALLLMLMRRCRADATMLLAADIAAMPLFRLSMHSAP